MKKWAFRVMVVILFAIAIVGVVSGLAGIVAETTGRECLKAKTVLICNEITCQQEQKCVEWAKGDTMEQDIITTEGGIITLLVHPNVAAYITIMAEGQQPQRLSFAWHEIGRAKLIFGGLSLLAKSPIIALSRAS